MASAASTLAAAVPGCLAAAGRTSALSSRDARRCRRVTFPAAHPGVGANTLRIGSLDSADFLSHVRDQTSGARSAHVTCAYGDVVGGTNYLIAGAIAIAVLGAAIPALFLRKDICPECDGAGFVRSGNTRLVANAARKDQKQIVCQRCNGLGKLGQVDK
ncbi:hypothetical protein CBR_g52180 [Chara braunii]|uniref:Uncharacterized protein n=1 Tax=Chara braunii TaxID=69332 RepID=A0A388M9V1_CHABU|nr:hypothetical protein CBR_g52180 [Chara braunii]|eukprot:GBG91295.1 hypothetical protein CBR_g52180 [Chara braunii]